MSMRVQGRRDQQLSIPVEVLPSVAGNVTKLELRSCSPTRSQHFGTMSIASQANSLRVLTIENHQRSKFRRVGSCLLEAAKRIREERGLQDISLICQDEGSAVFFYKSGFRFVDHAAAEKNAALAKLVDQPDGPLPDEVVLLGDMVK